MVGGVAAGGKTSQNFKNIFKILYNTRNFADHSPPTPVDAGIIGTKNQRNTLTP